MRISDWSSDVCSSDLLGVEMTLKELQSVFERHGIRTIAPLGERLDPHLHEAMYEVEDPATPAGTVVQVIQPGYRLHDRLLRAARVGIAKGGPKAGTPENGNNRSGERRVGKGWVSTGRSGWSPTH